MHVLVHLRIDGGTGLQRLVVVFDLRHELTERGFVEIGEQELLIRYTTATARTPAVDPVHFPVELRPALPRRVPTVLEGQPTDGTV